MNKQAVLSLNVIPEGKEAWLSYDDYLTLRRLFETAPLPSDAEPADQPLYRRLHRFLTEVAGLDLLRDEAAIHFNAFGLLRRGYRVETITPAEYEDLRRLLTGPEEPAIDDMELHDTGGHRALYDYLTRRMGLSVEPGRGPVWRRAKDLVAKYEAEKPVKG